MKRSRTPPVANPFLLWTRLAWKTGEMMLASAQVIHHRTARMASPVAMYSARDRRELGLMGREKIEASIESVSAMTAQLMTMNPLLGARAVEHMMRGASALMSLAASRTLSQAMARRARLVGVMTRSAASTSQPSVAAARLALRGLKPIHSRAAANAKRLGKR